MKYTLLTLFLVFGFSIFAEKDSEIIVADVNGEKISKFELEVYHAKRLFRITNKRITKEGSLKELINRKLGIQQAIKNDLQNDPEVRARMNDILYHQQISKDLAPKFKLIQVSGDEVSAYYEQNPEYRTSHILYRLPTQPTPEQVKEGLTKMLDIYQKLQADPSLWNQMVKENSQAQNLPETGDIGFQPKASLAPEYYDMIKGKDINFISRPVRTQYGYHIIKVTGKRPLKDANQYLYKKIIYDIKKDQIIDKYFSDLQNNTKVTIHKEKI
ncbi:MAG: peptidylprolyl isomerase [Halobacteriovoraceae bacterium]|nr:peptidylprolyl isomerase [Halobacteriovoraceae bacterium]